MFFAYVCLRPVRWFDGVPSPVRHPENVNMVIFRENTEDIYAGIEYPAGSQEVQKLIHFLQTELLKQAWGWDGFIVSDWGSIQEMILHGVAAERARTLGIKRMLVSITHTKDLAVATAYDFPGLQGWFAGTGLSLEWSGTTGDVGFFLLRKP